MATVVCGARGRGACMGNFGNFWEFLRGVGGRLGIPRGFACRWEVGRVGADLPQGYAGNDGNGGARAAGVWRLLMDQVDLMDLMDNVGAPRDTPWVCCAVVWFGSGADLPRGKTKLTKPKNKSGSETRRVSRRTHEPICEGFLRDSSLKRSGNAPDR